MVKIQTRINRKKYKRNQPAYEYKQHLILIPMSKNKEIEPFLQQQLDIELSVNENTLNLKLKKQNQRVLKMEKIEPSVTRTLPQAPC